MATNDIRNVWELTRAQRELVSNSFEENMYETAIAMLDQLRASEFNPWPHHVCQLIYISLQSTTPPSMKDEFDTSVQASPSKILKQQQLQISANLIPAKAILDAQRVLMAYLHTGSPDALALALPQRRSQPVTMVDPNETESTVARRAAHIMQLQDCWELLRSDFSSRQNALPSTPKVKSKTRRQSERLGYVDASLEAGQPLAVQENAWPLLEWLVGLFEKDEKLSLLPDPISPLLLNQLLDSDGKTHLDSSIAIIAHCLQQDQLQRRRLAGRLLSLLVNLTSTADLDLNALSVALYTRVSSFSQLSQLLSQLGHSTTIQALKFKIGVCQMLIGGLGLSTTGSGPKPQPRIRPRPTKNTKNTKFHDDSTDSQVTAKPSVPSIPDILRLVQTPTFERVSEDGTLTPLWCKFQLLLAYGSLQMRMERQDRDTQWTKAVTETLPQVAREEFEQRGPEASMYQRLLENQLVLNL
ncbi:hypothetical protein NP233_g3580 [Leucocoprinus birnbaumii]|uniref:Uncharacterized protein n=1 Tax=Leucocoprinus birnbaumii TaxID=56174 RepID=A0AAD5VYW0_9AGAR|nr:hypothetical protein NP233_g3580 [Leucocoprinus birnbaumii]